MRHASSGSSARSSTRRDERRSTARTAVEQERLRALHAERERRPLLPLRAARERRTPIVWHADDLAVPAFTGTRIVEPSVAELRPYIDWTFFFHAWELKGRYPAILDDPKKGEAARELFEAANALLDRIESERSLTPRGVHGFWPAVSEGDDIVLADGNGSTPTRFPMLRQQGAHDDSRPNRSLADFVAPGRDGPHGPHRRLRRRDPRRGRARVDVRARRRRLQRDHGEGARRPARRGVRRVAAPAVTRRAWYAPDEQLEGEELVAERYRGIRPAFGYPACPDHSVKGDALRAPPRRGGGPRADRVVRRDPGLRGQRALLRASVGALLLDRPDRPRPGRGLRGAGRARSSRPPSGGSARTSPTTRAEPRPPAARRSARRGYSGLCARCSSSSCRSWPHSRLGGGRGAEEGVDSKGNAMAQSIVLKRGDLSPAFTPRPRSDEDLPDGVRCERSRRGGSHDHGRGAVARLPADPAGALRHGRLDDERLPHARGGRRVVEPRHVGADDDLPRGHHPPVGAAGAASLDRLGEAPRRSRRSRRRRRRSA